MVNYIPLTINASFYRTAPTTGQVSLTFNGNYFNGSFGTQSNTLQLKWYYKLKSDSNWTLGGTLVENTDYVITNNSFHSGTYSFEDDIVIGNNFDYRNAYDFKIEYIDKLVSNSTTQSVSKGIPIINWDDEHFNVNGSIIQNEGTIAFDNYSDTEQVIGTWIDGKPLYRKVIEVFITSQYASYNTGISNLKQVINARGMYIRSNSGYQNLVPSTYSGWEVYLYDFTNASFVIRFSNNVWNAGVDSMFVIMEYTKTTD